MRIVNVMISKVLGGVEQASVDYAKALASRGHDVLFVADKRGKSVPNIPSSDKIKPWLIRFNRWNVFLLFPLYATLKAFRPNIVIVHSKKAIRPFKIVARLLGVKIVAVAHNPKLKEINRADAVFSITQYQKDIFVQKGLPADKVFVVPNLIDDDRPFKPLPPFRKPPVVGVIGRFDPMKGFPDFVRALGILKRKGVAFKGVIGGAPVGKDQREYDLVCSLIRELGLSDDVSMAGWFADKDAFYDQIDVFVLSSNYEPFGIVLLEAMVRSKPVVSSLAEGPGEIFAGNAAAFTFPVRDYEALADRLETALTDFDLAARTAENGYRLVRDKYLAPRVAETLEKAVVAVLEG